MSDNASVGREYAVHESNGLTVTEVGDYRVVSEPGEHRVMEAFGSHRMLKKKFKTFESAVKRARELPEARK